MGNIFSFDGFIPVVHESSFVHPNATITGNVIIGKNVYVGPGAAIRGDWGQIIIEDGCNIQENCTLHMFPGVVLRLHQNAHIGHGAVIHGATIGPDCLVGMNAVIMDRVVIEEESIIGALSFVAADTIIPKRSVAVGNPARVVKQVTDEMLAWKKEGTTLYQRLPKDCFDTLYACEPLREVPPEGRTQPEGYKTWRETKEKNDHV